VCRGGLAMKVFVPEITMPAVALALIVGLRLLIG
jgi:hypothetical protein